MTRITFFLSLFLVLFVFPANAFVVNFSQLYVVDGDTIFLGKKRFRFVGIDAPEIREPQCQREFVLGQKAKSRLTELLKNARKINILPVGEKDKYGRFLVQVFVDGKNAGKILVSEKLALPWKAGRKAWLERKRAFCF